VAEGAFHPSTMLLPILVADQTDVRAPLGQPGLIRLAVANLACGDVSHVSPVVRLWVARMAKAAVRRRLVVHGMATGANLGAASGFRLGVAGRASETHVYVRLMWEPPDRRRHRVLRGSVVAEQTVGGGGVMEAVATLARVHLYRHGRRPMAGVASESHGEVGIVEERPPGESDGVTCRLRVAESTGSG
jgi:hypothetical protein